MTQVELQPTIGKTKRKVHADIKIDMTPMVDLGFLLITFFIFTTSMAEARVTQLFMPKDGDSTPVKQSHVLTALIADNNKFFVYEGDWKTALATSKIAVTDYNVYQGLGKFIRVKQQLLGIDHQKKEFILIIKPLHSSSYKNFVDALDEVMINGVEKYAIVGP